MPSQFLQNPLQQFEPEKLPVGWPWRLFLTSFFIFLASLLTYFGLVYGYEPYLESKIKAEDEEINKLSQTVSKDEQDKFIQFYSQIVNLKSLLDNHISASKVFSLLEKIINQKVYFSGASLKVPERELELEGFAQSYAVLAEQLESFNQAEGIEKYNLSESKSTGQEVIFKVILTLKPEVLK